MTDINHTTAAQIKSIIERIERIEAEEAQKRSDKKDVYAEAKSNGFDVKTLKRMVRLRKIDRDKRDEEDAILDAYMVAIGEV